MAFKGTINKEGRRKGVPNKTTAQVREAFAYLLEQNLDALDLDIKSLDPYQRLKIILELAKFVVPTLKATELTTNQSTEVNPVIIQFNADKN